MLDDPLTEYHCAQVEALELVLALTLNFQGFRRLRQKLHQQRVKMKNTAAKKIIFTVAVAKCSGYTKYATFLAYLV